MLNGAYVEGVFVPQVQQFDKLFIETVFPPLADPELPAGKVSESYWTERMSEPCGPDGPDEDPADIADSAFGKSLEFYETMTAMHYTVLNLFTAGLFHLFEQQLGTLLTGEGGKRPEHPVTALRELAKSEHSLRIDVTAAPSWPLLEELQLVANVIKHAEGKSADKLRDLNNNYFMLPAVRGTELAQHFRGDRLAGEPLTGEGIYVTKEQYGAFVNAVIDFWHWLPRALDSGSHERR